MELSHSKLTPKNKKTKQNKTKQKKKTIDDKLIFSARLLRQRKSVQNLS